MTDRARRTRPVKATRTSRDVAPAAGRPAKPSALRWVLLAGLSLAVVALSAAIGPYAIYVARAPGPGSWGILPIAGLVVLLTLCGINALMERKGKRAWFSPGEALACFFVIVAGCWAIGWGFTETLLPLLTAPRALAGSQSGWAENIIPQLRSWAFGPVDEPYASGFYQGLEKGAAIPWRMWVVPALVWSLVAASITLCAVGVSGLLARRWIEHDRLSFPHAEVLSGVVGGFLSKRLFWWGALVAAVIPLWNVTQRFMPIFQRMPTYLTGNDQGVEWMAGVTKIGFPLNFGLLGILFFVQRDIVVSICVFFFAMALESRFLSLGGIVFQNNDMYYFSGAPIDWQMCGAFITFVVAGLWAGRKFLAGFIRNGIRGGKEGGA